MKRSRWLLMFALLMSLALIGAACAQEAGDGDGAGAQECPDEEFGCVEVAEGDPIKLGTLLVISGPNAALGSDSQAGAELGVEMREGGGEVMGHPIEWVHEDDLCAAEGGQAGAQKLASDPEIVAVIGTSCSSAGVPAAEILSEQGIVLISPSNTAPDLTDPETHQPFYLRTAHNDKIQGAAMAQFVLEELNAKTAATIHDGSPYAEGLQSVFATKFEEGGGQITAQEAIQVGDKDFRPVLTSIAATEPDFLYYPIFVEEGGGITKQARDIAELQDTDLGGADGMLTPDWIEAAGKENAEGVYLSGPSLEFAGDFYQDEFLPAYEEKTGGEPTSVFHAHAFDATNMVLDAIEESAIETEDGGLMIPRTQFKEALFATEGYEGITGTLTCNETGDCQPQAEMAVNVVKNGKFKPIFTVTLELEEAE